MPATSKAQFRFMQGVKHNPAFARRVGVSRKVASEFVEGQENYKSLPARKPELHRRIVRG